MRISIIDYGLGNHNSILNICKRIKLQAEVTSDREKIIDSDFIILPGVGSFNIGMKNIAKLDLIETLNEAIT